MMKDCPDCGGTGDVEVDYAIRDFVNGGYIQTEIETCRTCDGSGEVEDWEYEEEDDD